MPPGTGGELIGLRDILSRVDGAIVVTTPQTASLMDARKAIAACREAEIPVLGVVENMSGGPFGGGGGELVAMAMQVPFLGRIPLDPRLTARSDAGRPPVVAEPDSPGARALTNLAHRLAAAMPLTTR